MTTSDETLAQLNETFGAVAPAVDAHIRALIAEATVQPPPPLPPPPETELLVGATIDPFDGMNYMHSIADFERRLEAPLTIIRDFDGGDPPVTWEQGGNHYPGWSLHTANRHRAVSVKGWNHTQASLKHLMMSFPDDGFTTRFIIQHEVDNRRKGNDPDKFRTMLNRQHAAWVEMGRPSHIIPTFCLMGWWDRDPGQAWPYDSSASWFPSKDIVQDYEFTFDPYDVSTKTSLADLCKPTVDVWRKYTATSDRPDGAPWGIAEWGTKKTGAEGAKEIEDFHEYLRNEGATIACFFHSKVGDEGPWWFPFNDEAMVEAFRAELIRSHTAS